MRYVRYGSFTTAAVLIGTVVLIGIGGPSAAARVQKAMDEVAKAKSVRVVQKVGDDVLETTHFQGDVVRYEVPDKQVLIFDLKTRKGLELDLQQKTASRIELSDEEAKVGAEELAATRDFLGFFRGIKDASVKELKGETINGRAVKVFELNHPGSDPKYPAMKATLCVDEKTGFPVRLRPGEPQIGPVFEFGPWNEKFDAKLFRLDVPEGFKLIEPAPQQKKTEETTLLGLLHRAASNVAKAKSVRFATTGNQNNGVRKGTISILGTRMRIDDEGFVTITDTKEKVALRLNPAKKEARKFSPKDQESGALQNPLDQIVQLKDKRTDMVGQDRLGERKVQVFRVKGGSLWGLKGDWTVWVDPKTELPVRMQLENIAGAPDDKLRFTLDEFEWNVDLDAKLFRLDAPEGYKLIEDNQKK